MDTKGLLEQVTNIKDKAGTIKCPAFLKFLGDETLPVHSYIVFSERCELKNIQLNGVKQHVLKRNELFTAVQHNVSIYGSKLAGWRIEKYKNPGTCPRCGGNLVLRTVKRGERKGLVMGSFYAVKKSERKIPPLFLLSKNPHTKISRKIAEQNNNFFSALISYFLTPIFIFHFSWRKKGVEKYVRRRTCCTGYYTECIIDDNIQVDNIFKDDTNTGNYTSVIDNSKYRIIFEANDGSAANTIQTVDYNTTSLLTQNTFAWRKY